MAKDNKKGTPYLGLGLEKTEEDRLRKYLKDKDISAKQLMRMLIRKLLKETL